MQRWLGYTVIAGLVLVLTVLTQIGGLVLLVAWAACRVSLSPRLPLVARPVLIGAVFVGFYALATLFVVPPLARAGGRVPLPCKSDGVLGSASVVYCMLNRQYVALRLCTAVDTLSENMARQYPGTRTLTLDGSFPFLDGFPLAPHLSHDDGLKLDIAYYYLGTDGKYAAGVTRSPVGYFAFEQPRETDSQPCAGRSDVLTFRWDFGWLQTLLPPLKLDEARTRAAVDWLATSGRSYGVKRIFIEPHLVERLGLRLDIIRFQGCRAARHDDHVHFEVDP